jgi:hypothetical protein
MLKYSDNWGGLTAENKSYYEDTYERFVPFSGKANTVGGEIVRAISRICYRFYNDGDTVARYYSSNYNHSFGAEKFLSKHVPSYYIMRDITDDGDFEKAVCKNLKAIVDYLRKNPALFEVENYEDFLDLSPYEEWPYEEEEYEDEYDD